MGERTFPVTFVPANVTVWVPAGITVLQAARAAGVLIAAPCGGRGVCGKCGVRVVEGELDAPDDQESLGLAVAPPTVRLACRARIRGPVSLRPVLGSRPVAAETAAEDFDEQLLAAVDLGTTSVEAVLFGARSGKELGRGASANLQASWGADVVARVSAALDGAAEELRQAAEESVVRALSVACGKADACLDAVSRLVIAANSVMSTSLLGEPLDAFAAHPFHAPFTEPRPILPGGPLASALSETVHTTVLPPLASFVGGDTLAGLLAAGLVDSGGTALYVDAGTNAEIVALAPTGYVLASAAAGPAIEGGGITSGGPAGDGAVRSVTLAESGDIVADVIGGGEGAWLSGSGVVSCVAMLRKAGHLAADGVLTEHGPLADRFSHVGDVLAVRIAGSEARPVWVTQIDIRAFQTAKAAIASGIVATVRAAGLKPKRLGRLVLAGALGAALDPADLVALGIVPTEFAGLIERAGNASLLGAAMIASDMTLLDDARAALSGARHLELAADEGFTGAFLDALGLEPYSVKHGFTPHAR